MSGSKLLDVCTCCCSCSGCTRTSRCTRRSWAAPRSRTRPSECRQRRTCKHFNSNGAYKVPVHRAGKYLFFTKLIFIKLILIFSPNTFKLKQVRSWNIFFYCYDSLIITKCIRNGVIIGNNRLVFVVFTLISTFLKNIYSSFSTNIQKN